ncbi:MAG: hypothetical protein U9O87_11300 [Verrucomicrobiota bacterium]|nr:hypothetical protein [Verrucomicrobiota bacterium]
MAFCSTHSGNPNSFVGISARCKGTFKSGVSLVLTGHSHGKTITLYDGKREIATLGDRFDRHDSALIYKLVLNVYQEKDRGLYSVEKRIKVLG